MHNGAALTAVLFTCTIASLPALGGEDSFTYVTDIRRCSASYSGNGSATTTDSRRTPFELFEGGAQLNITNGVETWFPQSTQISNMDGSSMEFVGAGAALIIASPLSPPLQTLALSKFDLYFTIDAPTDYILEGVASHSGHDDSFAIVTLSLVEENPTVIENVDVPPGSPQTFSFHGTLLPGMYRLMGEARAACATEPPEIFAEAAAACSFRFLVRTSGECRADWNADGEVDSDDLFKFLDDFFALTADFDHDGATDTDDLFQFLGEFLHGC